MEYYATERKKELLPVVTALMICSLICAMFLCLSVPVMF